MPPTDPADLVRFEAEVRAASERFGTRSRFRSLGLFEALTLTPE